MGRVTKPLRCSYELLSGAIKLAKQKYQIFSNFWDREFLKRKKIYFFNWDSKIIETSFCFSKVHNFFSGVDFSNGCFKSIGNIPECNKNGFICCNPIFFTKLWRFNENSSDGFCWDTLYRVNVLQALFQNEVVWESVKRSDSKILYAVCLVLVLNNCGGRLPELFSLLHMI